MQHGPEPAGTACASTSWAYGEFTNVIPFRPRAAAPFEDSFAEVAAARHAFDERQQSIDRLKRRIRRGTVVYVVLRQQHPDPGWLIGDFYLISGRSVRRVTRDLALATDCWDPERELGVRLRNPPDAQPLNHLIGDILSRALFGVPDRIEHRVIE